MDYAYSLSRAWTITWKFKVLWIFGILAGCSTNSNGSGNINYSYSEDMGEISPAMIEMGNRALNFLVQPAVIVGVILFVLLIMIITVFFSTIGRVGLISGTYKAEMGAERLGFRELFSDGTSRFWQFFGMKFLVSLPFMIVILGLLGTGVLVAISADNSTNAEVFLAGFVSTLCLIFCCLFLFSLFIGMIIQQAQNAMIIEELGISASLIRGWEIFKKGLGHIILIAFIILIIVVMVGIAIALPILAVVVPSMLSFVLGGADSAQPLIIAGLCLVAYLPIALIANGALSTYAQAVWTLTYLQLSERD